MKSLVLEIYATIREKALEQGINIPIISIDDGSLVFVLVKKRLIILETKLLTLMLRLE